MADGTLSSAAVEVRPLPSLEEFARFLLDREEAEHPEVRIAHRELLHHFAAVWANYEGIPNRVAQAQADALYEDWARSMLLTAEEREAEYAE
jgi:hypothetical protein